MATERLVTAAHTGSAYPRLVAENHSQCTWALDVLLRDDGPHETVFYVAGHPVAADGPYPQRWLRTGTHNGLGAAFFHDASTPPDEDWAWVAINPEPLENAPTIFYDAPTPVIFPPAAVLPLPVLREAVLEWCDTGARPTGVPWLAVNDQQWDLDEKGDVVHSYPGPRRTMHHLVRGRVVREYGWGTDRPAPGR